MKDRIAEQLNTDRPSIAIDRELAQGKQWIERGFWSLLPERKGKPGDKISWSWNTNYQLHTLQVEIDAKHGSCQFAENEIRDCVADRTVQKITKGRLKILAGSLLR